MALRTGIVLDSSIDLPRAFLDRERIVVLPISIQIGSASITDDRDPRVALGFIDGAGKARTATARTTPLSVDAIRDLFLSRLVLDYDFVFCITLTRSRSALYDNALQACEAVSSHCKPMRAAAGDPSPFALRVVDSQNMFAAAGIVAVEAARLRAAGEDAPRIRQRLEQVAECTHGYMLAPDIQYLRRRIRQRGDRSVGLWNAMAGDLLDLKPILHCHRGETGTVARIRGFDAAAERLFDHVASHVTAGLLTPVVTLGYGGALEALHALPGYARLRDVCHAHRVELLESVMSMTGMVNVGRGALVAGFAGHARPFA